MKNTMFRCGVVTVALGLAFGPLRATAAPSVTVNETFTATAGMTDAALPDFVIGGFAPTDLLLVAVALDDAESGTSLTFPVNTGLTLEYGYSVWTSVTEIAFTGSQSDANAALAAMTITTGGTAGVPVLKVNVALNDNEYSLNPMNGHFYKYVASSNIHWQDANTAAEAMRFRRLKGYLVTITDADENAYVTSKIEGATNVWIGASDEETEGRWKWMGGPEKGKVFWEHACVASPPCGGVSGTESYLPGTPAVVTYDAWVVGVEPNNSYGSYSEESFGALTAIGEDHAVTNWNGVPGEWNDIYKEYPGPSGYVVEFSGSGSSVAVSGTTLTLDGSPPSRGDLGGTGFSPWLLTLVALAMLGGGIALRRPSTVARP